MAAQESAIKSLQEEVTCPVCQEIYCNPSKTPKKLPCDHIFCFQCLQKLSSACFNDKLTCPVCRATSTLHKSDASLFPTAHQVNRLIDIYHKSLKEHTQNTSAPIETPQSPTCSLHNSQPLAVYCETCHKAVCRDCALTVCAPKKHNYGFLEEVAKKYKNELDSKVKPLQELQKHIVDATVAIAVNNSSLEEQKRDEVEQIEAAFKSMSQIIAEQRNQIVCEAQDRYDVQVAKNKSQVEELNRALQNLATAFQTTKKLDIVQSLTTSNDNTLSTQKQHLQTLHFQYKKLLLCTSTELHTEPYKKIEYLPQKFDPRSLLFYAGCNFKCCISEFDKLKSLRLRTPFEIVFQLDELKSGSKIKSKLICVHDKSTVSVNVAKVPPNQIRLTITPQSRGSHMLDILSGDSYICGSPIPAYVFFEPQQLPINKPKSIAVENATAIKCHDNQVMISSSPFSLTIFVNRNLTVTKIIQCPGINEFAVHDNFLFYSDIIRDRLVKSDMNGRIVASTGEKGCQPSQFKFPNGIRVNNNQIFVCDTENGRIKIYDTDLRLLKILGNAPGQFAAPFDLVFDKEGRMYVLENKNNRIQVLSDQGDHLRFIGESYFREPISLAVCNEYLFVTDMTRKCVSVHTLMGIFVTSFAAEGSIECIDIDKNGFIYVTSSRKTLLIF